MLQGKLGYVADRGGRVRAVDWTVRDLPLEKALFRIRAQLYGWRMLSEAPVQKGSVWYFRKRGEEFSSTPVVAQGTVYAAARSGAVYALDQEDGRVVWEARVGRGVIGSPVVLGRTLIVGDEGGTLYGFDARNGGEKWSVGLEGGHVGAAAFAFGMVYAATESGAVYALN